MVDSLPPLGRYLLRLFPYPDGYHAAAPLSPVKVPAFPSLPACTSPCFLPTRALLRAYVRDSLSLQPSVLTVCDVLPSPAYCAVGLRCPGTLCPALFVLQAIPFVRSIIGLSHLNGFLCRLCVPESGPFLTDGLGIELTVPYLFVSSHCPPFLNGIGLPGFCRSVYLDFVVIHLRVPYS